MRKVREVIIVEGRYDKNTLSQLVDATILETGGFSVFRDKQKLALLRRMAKKRGVILLTDSDGAGFVIRNFLKGALPREQVKQAYIPDIEGKERRKRKAGKEGKLGVEGMSPDVLMQVLERAGATFEDDDRPQPAPSRAALTKQDLYELGLAGGQDSAAKRAALQKKLDLPEHLSANALLEVLNLLYSPGELADALSELRQNGEISN
jgi:ribonuclease M5